MDSRQAGKTGLKLRNALLIGSLVGFLLVSGWWLFEARQRPLSSSEAKAPVAEDALQREIILYFASPDGSRLLAENGFIADCSEDEICLRGVVEALIAGPRQDSVAVLPADSRLHDLELQDSLVVLNFDATFINGHPGGTQSELLSVYALANTLAVNFPHVRQVAFQVAGQPIETIKGHIDLRQPIAPDFSLVDEAETAVGDLPTLSAGSE
ncbi:MAG TPA: GerMN domain-containing protein [Desulfuromonadales bacterium]|nr:GerMN domain-containing protein [Desulfuromonadales bacterium]